MSLQTPGAPGTFDKQWFFCPLGQEILLNLKPWLYIYPYEISAYEFSNISPNYKHISTLNSIFLTFVPYADEKVTC